MRAFLESVAELGPGDHACLVFDSDELRREAAVAFLKAGAERGERLLIVSANGNGAVDAELAPLTTSGQLVRLSSGRERASGDVLARSRTVARDALADGYRAVRVLTAVEDWTVDELQRYERGTRDLFDDGTFTALCEYDRRRHLEADLIGLQDLHGRVVFALEGSDALRVEREADGRLRLSGWVDITSLGTLVEPLRRAMDGEADVELQLAEVTFVDVSGLRLLVEAAGRLADADRKLVFESPPEAVVTMLRVLGWDRVRGLEVRR